MNVHRFRPLVEVEAVQVDHGNLDEVADWCNGTVGWDDTHTRPWIEIPTLDIAGERAYIGDWVVHGATGAFFRVHPHAMAGRYQPLSLPPQTGTRSYAKHGDADYAVKTAAGCLAAGEPVFLLRAQDCRAYSAVQEWADSIPNRDLAAEAFDIADAMVEWPWRKEPD